MFLTLFKSILRQHLEYGRNVWYVTFSPILCFLLVAWPKCTCLHFDLLNLRSHLSDQCTRLFISFCKLCCSSSLFTTVCTVVSSANNLKNKANQGRGMIKRSFSYMEKEMFLTLFKSIVRSHLEYGRHVWYVIYLKRSYANRKCTEKSDQISKQIYNIWTPFHMSTILCEKLHFLVFVLLFFLYTFWLWLLVAVRFIVEMCSCRTLSMSLRILKVSIMSALSLLYCSDGNPRYFKTFCVVQMLYPKIQQVKM
jgi:hypothetical protein